MRIDVDGHDTPFRNPDAPSPLPGRTVGVGIRWTAHLCPFHTSASVSRLPPIAPTAVHAVTAAQETPRSSLFGLSPSGFPVVLRDQALPFQCSANVSSCVGPVRLWHAVEQ